MGNGDPAEGEFLSACSISSSALQEDNAMIASLPRLFWNDTGNNENEDDDDDESQFVAAAAADEVERLRQSYEEREKEMLSRTIFVTNVKCMHSKANERALEQFFNDLLLCRHEENNKKGNHHSKNKTNYQRKYSSSSKNAAAVEVCWATGYDDEADLLSSDPPARVRFRRQTDAERLFGGKPLLGLLQCRLLPCHLGTYVRYEKNHQTFCIKIRPSFAYPRMLPDIDTTIKLSTMGLSLGHWYPAELDAYRRHSDDDDDDDDDDLWLEEMTTDLKPTLCFDLRNRRLELKVQRVQDDQDDTSYFQYVEDNLSIDFHKIVGGKLQLGRLVDGQQPQAEYALVFSMQHPPKIETETPLRGLGYALNETRRHRSVRFDHVPAEEFGRCLGYKLRLHPDKLHLLFGSSNNSSTTTTGNNNNNNSNSNNNNNNNSEILTKLQDFGLFRRSLQSLQQARRITVKTAPQVDELTGALTMVHEMYPRAGMSNPSFITLFLY
jgi:hypothetical protein